MKRTAAGALAALPLSSTSHARIPAALVCSLHGAVYANLKPDGTIEREAINDTMSLTIAAIDLEKKSAQVIGNAGAAPVYAFKSQAGLNIMEATPTGNINLLTVMLVNQGSSHPAAYSRHIFDPIISGMVSQYYGACKDKT
jgi:hypothetical protein